MVQPCRIATAPRQGPLTILTAVVLLLAGLAAGGLTWLARHSVAETVPAGCVALAAGAQFFDWLIT